MTESETAPTVAAAQPGGAPVPAVVGTALRYAVASGVPALINFASLVIYTRLLTPGEYGEYALVMAVVASANAIGFQWARAGARRYLPDRARRARVLRSLPLVYLGLAGLAVVVAAAAVVIARPFTVLIGLGLLLLLCEAWFELTQEVAIADLRPGAFGVAALSKAVLALGITLLLLHTGIGSKALILGLAAGFALPAWLHSGMLRPQSREPIDGESVRMLLAYGLPLTASYALQFVLDSSDRLLLGGFRGSAPVGSYAAAYDLASQTLTLLFMMVNLAAYPIALRMLGSNGTAAARSRLSEQAVLLAGIGLPAFLGIAILAPVIAPVMLGAQFAPMASALLPIIAVGVFAAGIKAFYFDLAFQIGERTLGLIHIGIVAAVVNVLVNLVAIPRWGATGAASTTLLAFVVAAVLSATYGRRVLALPLPWAEWGKLAIAAAVMIAAIWPFRSAHGAIPLAVAVATGGGVYLAVVVMLDVGGSRRAMWQWWGATK